MDVRKTWVDEEGGTCCQLLAADHCYGHAVGMIRVDASRKALEFNMRSASVSSPIPENIDPRSHAGDWTVYLA